MILEYYLKNPDICKRDIGFEFPPAAAASVTSIIQKYQFKSALNDDDIIQELICKLLNSHRDHDDEYTDSVIVPYLNLITHRICKDKNEYEKRRAYENIDLPKHFNSVMIDEGDIQKLNMEFDMILNSLPRILREVLKLNYEGYGHKEISKILGISIENSRKRLQRARTIISEIFPKKNFAILAA